MVARTIRATLCDLVTEWGLPGEGGRYEGCPLCVMATPLTCRQRLDAETMKVEGKLSVEPFDQITAVTAGKRCGGICRDLRPSFILMVHQPLMPWWWSRCQVGYQPLGAGVHQPPDQGLPTTEWYDDLGPTSSAIRTWYLACLVDLCLTACMVLVLV